MAETETHHPWGPHGFAETPLTSDDVHDGTARMTTRRAGTASVLADGTVLGYS
jgi:hypothetical protein